MMTKIFNIQLNYEQFNTMNSFANKIPQNDASSSMQKNQHKKRRQLNTKNRYKDLGLLTNNNTISNNNIAKEQLHKNWISNKNKRYKEINRSSQSIRIHTVTKNSNSKQKFMQQPNNRYYTINSQQQQQRSSLHNLGNKETRKNSDGYKSKIKKFEDFYQKVELLKKQVTKIHGQQINWQQYQSIEVSQKQKSNKLKMRNASSRIIFRFLNKKNKKLVTQAFLLVKSHLKPK